MVNEHINDVEEQYDNSSSTSSYSNEDANASPAHGASPEDNSRQVLLANSTPTESSVELGVEAGGSSCDFAAINQLDSSAEHHQGSAPRVDLGWGDPTVKKGSDDSPK